MYTGTHGSHALTLKHVQYIQCTCTMYSTFTLYMHEQQYIETKSIVHVYSEFNVQCAGLGLCKMSITCTCITYRSLDHVVSTETHVSDKVKYVYFSFCLHHSHHGVNADESPSPTHTSTEVRGRGGISKTIKISI